MCISDILHELLGSQWEEIDSSIGVGIDRFFTNTSGDEACVNENQDVLTISKDGNKVWSGDKSEFDE